jgi:hypothetical protein
VGKDFRLFNYAEKQIVAFNLRVDLSQFREVINKTGQQLKEPSN